MSENPLIEILQVEKLSKKSESLIGFNIDSLKKGQKINTYSISIRGKEKIQNPLSVKR